MAQIAIEVFFFILTLVGILLMPAGIPGNFMGTALLLIHRLIYPGESVSFWLIVVCLVLAVAGEIVESFMGILGAKKFGAGKAGMAASFAGGIVGGIAGSMVLPLIGTLAGVFIGGFIFTFAAEALLAKKTTADSAKAGLGALLGRVVSVQTKYTAGLIILIIMVKGFWL